MPNHAWQFRLIPAFLVVLLLSSCNKADVQQHESALPTAVISSSVTSPSEVNKNTAVVADALTSEFRKITRENVSQLGEVFRIGEGSFQDEFAVSPDNSKLAILSGGGVIFVDTTTWERTDFFALEGTPKSIAYSPDGNSIAVIFVKKLPVNIEFPIRHPYISILKIFEASSHESSLELTLSGNGCATDAAWNIAFAPDGEKITYWGINSHSQQDQQDNLCIHSSVDGRLLSKYAIPTNSSSYTRPIFFSQDSTKLYSIGVDENSVWSVLNEINIDDGSLRRVSGGIGNISDFFFDKKSNHACLTGDNGTAIVSLLDFSHKETAQIASLRGEKISCSPDRGLVFISTESGYYLFGADGYKLLWGPNPKPENLALGREQMASRIVERTDRAAFDVNESKVFVLHNNHGRDDDFLEILDVQTGQEIHRIYGQNPAARFAISPDNQVVAIAGFGNGLVQLWSVNEGKVLFNLRSHERMVYQALFSPDGRSIATASADATVKLWDSRSGNLISTLSGHQAPVWTIAFSKSGELLYSAGDDPEMVVWNLSTGSLERRINLPESTQQHRFILPRPSDRTILVASSCYSVLDCKVPWISGDLVELDTSTGQVLHKFPFATQELAISSDGSMLSGVFIRTPEIVHFAGKPFEGERSVKTFKSPSGNGFLYGSAMSKDGQLFFGLNGKEMLIWDIASQTLIGSLPADLSGRMLFSENQKSLWIMDSGLGVVVVWAVN